MRTQKSIIRLIGIFLLFSLFTACGGTPQANSTATSEPLMSTATNAPLPTPTVAPTTTQITINGNPDDWAGRQVLLEDPVGDAEEGFLDLTNAYAFVNQNALYFLIETVDTSASFVQFDIQFETDDRNLQISWAPGQQKGYLGDFTSQWIPIGEISNSKFYLGLVLEGRVDLRDLGSPSSIRLTSINVMGGKCCEEGEWRNVEQVIFQDTPLVNEIDPPALVSLEPKYVLARQFELPPGYVVDILLAAPLPHLFDIAQSESGVIYLGQVGDSAALSRLDPQSGEITKLVDFSGKSTSWMADGPGDTVILKVNSEVWMVNPDGTYEIWGQSLHGRPADLMNNGQMIGISDDQTTVIEIYPDGSFREIAGGFERIFDLVVSEEGVIFLEDFNTGDLVRVEPDGSKTVLQKQLIYRDYAALYIDSNGELFVFSPIIGFNQVNQETGKLTRFAVEDNPCQLVGSVFVITAENKALFVNTKSQVVELDIATGSTKPIVRNNGTNSQAMTIGPDNALYIGTSECPNQPSRVTRIQDDGSTDVYLDGLLGDVLDIVFDTQGGLYVATRENTYHVYYLPSRNADLQEIPYPPGGGSSLAINPENGNLLLAQWGGKLYEYVPDAGWKQLRMSFPKGVNEFWIKLSQDGSVYAYSSESERASTGPMVNRWILKLDLVQGSSGIVAQLDRYGCCVVGNLNIDPLGNIWWILNPENLLFTVAPDGKYSLFAKNLPQDSPQVAVDEENDVYISGIFGVMRFYKEQ